MMNSTKKEYDFSSEKNNELKKTRDISFEEVIEAIEDGSLITVVRHPNKEKYPNQQMYLVDIEEYIYVVPFVKKDENTVFLKTIFKSRKMTKEYLKERGK